MFHSLASYFYGNASTNDPDNTLENNNNNNSIGVAAAAVAADTNTPNSTGTAATTNDEFNNKKKKNNHSGLKKSFKPSSSSSLSDIDVDNNDDDDDWLLLDYEDSSPQPDSEEEIPFVEIKNAPVLFKRGRHSRNNSGAGSHDGLLSLSPTSILPSSMEESWFVTPPPCFTSTGPAIMEMSPFENLLIEHPSMSVYHSMRRSTTNHPTAVEENDDENDDDNVSDVIDDGGIGGEGIIIINMGLNNLARRPPPIPQQMLHPAADRSPAHTVRVRTEHAGNYRTMKQYLAAVSVTQKGPGQKHNPSLCRNAIERNNKVREVNSKGGRQKRSDKNNCKVISRANNNRKC